MKVCGQIPGNVTPICQTSQNYYLMWKTPYERRFGQPFKGPIIPFGSLVEYHPTTAKDQVTNPSIWKESFYLDCSSDIWKGDVLVADLEELETMEASEIFSKRLNAKEVIFHQGEFLPNRRWTNQNPWRRSGPENIHLGTASTPIQGESNIDILGESEGSPLPQPHDLTSGCQ